MEDVGHLVSYRPRGGRAYMTLHRPDERNALTDEMLDAIVSYIEAAERDDDVRVIVIRGDGEDFCAGHDLAQVGSEYGFADKPGARRPSQRARLHFDKRHLERAPRLAGIDLGHPRLPDGLPCRWQRVS